jgi:hypothetical protein
LAISIFFFVFAMSRLARFSPLEVGLPIEVEAALDRLYPENPEPAQPEEPRPSASEDDAQSRKTSTARRR